MEDEFVDGIRLVFESGDDGEPLAALEKGKDFAAPNGRAGGVDEAELSPCVDGGTGSGLAGSGL